MLLANIKQGSWTYLNILLFQDCLGSPLSLTALRYISKILLLEIILINILTEYYIQVWLFSVNISYLSLWWSHFISIMYFLKVYLKIFSFIWTLMYHVCFASIPSKKCVRFRLSKHVTVFSYVWHNFNK